MKRSTKLLTFSGSYLPEHFMTKIGYSRDIAKEHLKDQEFADRLQAAIREVFILLKSFILIVMISVQINHFCKHVGLLINIVISVIKVLSAIYA